ncbi:2-dehydro-3-deoxygalactonokinase [Celeribacter sp.]|uniref:2-dehydro-3-deoxygalactonokinase n=1 Tax=Celeribacter sp. TaxID=1890673 RepID=UPI003A9561C2
MDNVAFIGVDWGTTSFRLWALEADGTVAAFTNGPFGMANLKRSDYGSVLEDSLAKVGIAHDVPVVICGMAGAAQGWCEAPYLPTPTPLYALGSDATKVRGTTRDVRILPGVKQLSPANVMRGEETQIAGLLHHHPDFSGTVCLPGTHTKWVRVENQSILDFDTCMTGEQFGLFSSKSVLSHSMLVDGWSDAAFEDAVNVALEEPETVPRLLFGIRANMLVSEQTAAEARARLSGLLIGQELSATRGFWENQNVTLIGAPELSKLYSQALGQIGIAARALNTDEMTIAGLVSAYKIQKERQLCLEK